ncbi:hypothetical protein [Affinibrenneria salicis]|uniref:hypothetical protein n=1 Tax=Affinibrenneria salicis TaxID=2590031 RepID=UPI00123D795F|nr:hypothetical protein [Affinibrenneria salicis]
MLANYLIPKLTGSGGIDPPGIITLWTTAGWLTVLVRSLENRRIINHGLFYRLFRTKTPQRFQDQTILTLLYTRHTSGCDCVGCVQ